MSSYTLLTFCFQLRFKRWMHYETEVLYMSRHPGNLHNKLGFFAVQWFWDPSPLQNINYWLKLDMCGNRYLHFLLCGLEHTFPGDLFEDLSKSWKHLDWI